MFYTCPEVALELVLYSYSPIDGSKTTAKK